MKRLYLLPLLVLPLLSGLAGCVSGIESRISERAEIFEAYAPETQTRLREGRIRLGDDQDAVWFVYGAPNDKLRRMDETGTLEIWIYKILGYTQQGVYPAVRPVYRDVRGTLRQSYYIDDTPEYEWKEVRRVEFRNGRVSAVQLTD